MILFVVIVVLVVDNFLLINAVIPSESMEHHYDRDRILETVWPICLTIRRDLIL